MVVGALYFVVGQSQTARVRVERDAITAAALAQAKEALIGYAITYSDTHPGEVFGYFPCPDTNGDGISQSPCGSTGQAVVGLLPYATLGVPVLRDADGECLWYAVSGAYKNLPKTVPMNWDTQGQFQINDKNGNPIVTPNNPTNVDDSGGAAVVVFAVGGPLATQSRSNSANPCGRQGTGYSAYIDSINPALPSTASTVIVQMGDSGSSTNNDRLMWITPKEVWNHIIARTNFADNIYQVFGSGGMIANALGDLAVLPGPKQLPPTPSNPSPPDSIAVGNMLFGFLDPCQIPVDGYVSPPPPPHYGCPPSHLAGLAPPHLDPNDAYLHNWLEQAFYVVCADQTQCLPCDDDSHPHPHPPSHPHLHTGVLIFSGRDLSASPRTSTLQLGRNEANRNGTAAQQAAFATSINRYLEGNNASNYLSGTSSLTYSSAAPSPWPSSDVVLCLDPH